MAGGQNPYTYSGAGEGFLTDYSSLAGAGSAFESFAKSFGAAQEAAAQREALKTKMQREKEQSAIEAYKAGGEFKPDGSFGERTLSVRENEDRELKAHGEGYKPDPDRPGHFIVDPTSPKYIAAKNAGIRAAGTIGTRQDNQSSAAVKQIHNDKTLIQMRGNATNVDKGLDLLSDPNHPPSVTAINEVAQDISKAISNSPVSSDFKLKEISTPTLQQKAAEIKRYLTSNPDQPAPPEVVKFWKDMGERLKGAFDRQMSARAKNLLIGQQRAYKHNPDAYESMKEAADLYQTGAWRGQDFGDASAAPQAAQGQPLVQSGLVKPGLVAAPPQTPQSQDPVTAAKLMRLQELKAKAGM